MIRRHWSERCATWNGYTSSAEALRWCAYVWCRWRCVGGAADQGSGPTPLCVRVFVKHELAGTGEPCEGHGTSLWHSGKIQYAHVIPYARLLYGSLVHSLYTPGPALQLACDAADDTRQQALLSHIF